MSKTRNISDLLDANGDVKSTALDNVPASNDASALTTGTLPDARLSSNITTNDGTQTLTNKTIASSQLTGALPSLDGSALTNVPGGVSNVNTVRVTSSGTYTPTSGTKFFTVYACGGGGGSGGVPATNGKYQASSGGNAGTTVVKTYTATEMGATASVSIGSGGSAGSVSSNGGTGGDTTFNPAGTGATITGKGGRGSYRFSTGQNGTGLPQHNHPSTIFQNGDYVIPGEFGQYGQITTSNAYRSSSSANYRFGGAGGNSAVGFGGNYTLRNSSGRTNGTSAVANTGGGAGGCMSYSQSATTTGGAGGSGVVIIMEYA